MVGAACGGGGGMDLSVVPYGGEMGGSRAKAEVGAGGGRYRECMRNHAAAMGGQAYDGCGEFMPGGECGSQEALKCAACGCHRNFHRREDPRRPFLLYNATAPTLWDKKARPPHTQAFPTFFPPPPHALPLPFRQVHPASFVGPHEAEQGRAGSETPPRGEGEEQQARKRFRTKFTAEQKEKMQAFAERVGWRIQRHDDAALEAFCGEVGVKRHVLKVWMHNNKHALASSNPPSNPTNSDTTPSPNPKPEQISAHPISV